jgi:hypothetical protein
MISKLAWHIASLSLVLGACMTAFGSDHFSAPVADSVPEPATLVELASGVALLGAAMFIRRNRR